jgi:hypothetical protein
MKQLEHHARRSLGPPARALLRLEPPPTGADVLLQPDRPTDRLLERVPDCFPGVVRNVAQLVLVGVPQRSQAHEVGCDGRRSKPRVQARSSVGQLARTGGWRRRNGPALASSSAGGLRDRCLALVSLRRRGTCGRSRVRVRTNAMTNVTRRHQGGHILKNTAITRCGLRLLSAYCSSLPARSRCQRLGLQCPHARRSCVKTKHKIVSYSCRVFGKLWDVSVSP